MHSGVRRLEEVLRQSKERQHEGAGHSSRVQYGAEKPSVNRNKRERSSSGR